MKRKNKKQSSKPSPSSNYAVKISPVRKAISNEPQVTKKKIKVKPGDAEIEISVKSCESEVCIQEFAPNQISEEQEEGAVRFCICSSARCHICSKTFHLEILRSGLCTEEFGVKFCVTA